MTRLDHPSSRSNLFFLTSGGSRGGARGAHPPLLFLDQTEAQRAEKYFFEDHPLPPCLRIWMTGPPLIWRSGSATAYVNSSLHFVMKCMKSWLAQDSWDKGLTLTLDIIKWGLNFLLLPNTGCLQLLNAGLIQPLLYSIFSLVFLFVLKDWWSKGLLLFRWYVLIQYFYLSEILIYVLRNICYWRGALACSAGVFFGRAHVLLAKAHVETRKEGRKCGESKGAG